MSDDSTANEIATLGAHKIEQKKIPGVWQHAAFMVKTHQNEWWLN